MLIDELLPVFHVSEQHSMAVNAPPMEVYAVLRSADLSRSWITRWLFLLRGLPALFRRTAKPARGRLTLEDFLASGFSLLGERPGQELALGLVGRFWRPTGDLLQLSADEFRSFAAPGYASAVMNFHLEPVTPSHSVLATETRVLCHDPASLRSFKRYWLVVRPFSGLIRQEMLRAIRLAAEERTSQTALTG